MSGKFVQSAEVLRVDKGGHIGIMPESTGRECKCAAVRKPRSRHSWQIVRQTLVALTVVTMAGTSIADDGRSVFPARAMYVRSVHFQGAESAQDLAHADFNADGLVDVAVLLKQWTAGSSQYTFTILWGQTDGWLVRGSDYPLALGQGFAPQQMAVADLVPDPDDLPDIVFGGNSEVDLLILRNLGPPDYDFIIDQTYRDFDAGRVTAGDFDGDGFVDIAHTVGRNGVHVRYGRPGGWFADPFQLPSGNPTYLACDDLDGDGRDDLVICDDNEVAVHYGAQDQAVGFDRSTHMLHPPSRTGELALADFNADGHVDIAHAVSYQVYQVYVYYGNDEGGFDAYRAFDAGTRADRLVAGDVDGDGRPDLIPWVSADNVNYQGGAVLYSEGTVGFTSPFEVAAGAYSKSVDVVDLDRDGRAELVIGDSYSHLAVLRSRPRGLITTSQDYHLVGNRPVALDTGDFDMDGSPDVCVLNGDDNDVRILWGTSEGTLELRGDDLPVGTTPKDVAVGHFDDDNELDLVATNAGNNSLTVWHSVAAVAPSYPYREFLDPILPADPSVIVTGYFNDDQRLDIAFLAGANIVVIHGDPGGSLDKDNPQVYELGSTQVDLASADLNNDGLPDLATINSAKSISVLYGQVDRTFGDLEQHDLSSVVVSRESAVAIGAGDLNDDGLIDLFASFRNTYVPEGAVVLLFAQQGGGFGEPVRLDCMGDYPGFLAVQDFDGDTIVDLAVSGQRAQHIWFGTGEGGFSHERYARRLGNHPYETMVVADFNSDGRPDIANIGLSPEAVSIMLNESDAKIRGDLAITAVSLKDAEGVTLYSGLAGDVVTVEWTVQNQLATPITGKWTDAVYLSLDGAWEIGDIRLGTKDFLGTLDAVGGTDDHVDRWLDVALPGVFPGDWSILVRTDATNAVDETDVPSPGGEFDNTAVTPINIHLPQLSVCAAGAPSCPGLDDTFTAQSRALYYEFQAVADEDLLVTLDLASEEGFYELYIRYGAIPSRSVFDAKHPQLFDTAETPDQTARIPGTQAGTYYVLAYARQLPSGGTVDFNLRAEYLPFELTAISPDVGGNVGQFTANLTGSHFTPETTVSLIRLDSQAYDAIAVYFESMGKIYPTFDLMGLEPGQYDIRIEDGAVRTVTNALTVVAGGGAVLSARLSMPEAVRAGQEFSFFIDLWNDGNTDAVLPILLASGSVPIWVPDSPSTLSNYLTIANSWPGPTDLLSSGAHARVELRSTAPNQLSIRFAATDSHAASDLLNWFKDRLIDLMLARFAPEVGAVLGPILTVLTDEYLGCHVLAFMLAENRARISELANIVEDPLFPEKEAALHDIHAALVAAWGAAGCGGDGGTVTVVTSSDPNDKLNPNGWGESHFVHENYTIPYTIRFENLPSATAAALKVHVTDQLSDDLDWSMLVLDEIGFAGTVIEVPDGLSHYEGQMEIDGWTWDEVEGCWVQYDDADIPLVPLVVDVEADIDSETGLVTWSIECADVNTGYFPEDPFAGFLPPNEEELFYPAPDDPNDPPRMIHPGEGYLTYSVQPVADLPTGTGITNVASIVFDWNAPMDTPEVLNTIDAAPPTTIVDPLPQEVNHARFEVCWSGADDPGGCGIESYSVYVSDSDGPYTMWLTTEDVCNMFTGAAVGHTYSFYSTARDQVGHVELPPTDAQNDTIIIPDATTTVRFGDFDGSGAVGLADYDAFDACLTVPGAGSVDPGCEAKDFDSDGDVDLADFASFQNSFDASD